MSSPIGGVFTSGGIESGGFGAAHTWNVEDIDSDVERSERFLHQVGSEKRVVEYNILYSADQNASLVTKEYSVITDGSEETMRTVYSYSNYTRGEVYSRTVRADGEFKSDAACIVEDRSVFLSSGETSKFLPSPQNGLYTTFVITLDYTREDVSNRQSRLRVLDGLYVSEGELVYLDLSGSFQLVESRLESANVSFSGRTFDTFDGVLLSSSSKKFSGVVNVSVDYESNVIVEEPSWTSHSCFESE